VSDDGERERLARHRDLATWGDRLVPLGEFRDAAAGSGTALSARERRVAAARYVAPLAHARDSARAAAEGPLDRAIVFGGIYSNHLALAALLEEAGRTNTDDLYCLGDLGGFGPHPEKVWRLLEEAGVRSIQGNYEQSLAARRDDCNCGYADPRDNRFAELSYRYTAEHCSSAYRDWMGSLPLERRLRIAGRELLCVHGSPRRINEFLFESTTPDVFLEVLLDQVRCDGLLFTHTGLPWHRVLPSGRTATNVGVIGRPANDGQTVVWYCRLQAASGGGLDVELRPLAYDHPALAREMREAGLPEEFATTIETGWWTTCLEILPAKERARSRH
jgi:hypothetical protein